MTRCSPLLPPTSTPVGSPTLARLRSRASGIARPPVPVELVLPDDLYDAGVIKNEDDDGWAVEMRRRATRSPRSSATCAGSSR